MTVKMSNDQKPAGYYDEIEYTWSKSDFLLEHFKEYSPSLRTNADAGYDYLDEKECSVIFEDPACEHQIELEMTDEFTFWFAGWHNHYFTYEYDFSRMVRDAENILENRSCVIVVERNGTWAAACLSDDPENIDSAYIKDRFNSPKDTPEKWRHEFDFKGCIANVYFWDKTRDFKIIMDD